MPRHINISRKTVLFLFLPCLYFIAFFASIYIGNRMAGRESNMLSLLFAIPFVVLLFKPSRQFSGILGIITLLLALYLSLAWLSDYVKITDPSINSHFIIGGLSFLAGNFTMSVLLLCYRKPVSQKLIST